MPLCEASTDLVIHPLPSVSNFWNKRLLSTMHEDMRSSSMGFPNAVSCSLDHSSRESNKEYSRG